ncbi:MAG: FkbM family methyltransferase, partial [candidate division WOR-3 bacterium]
MISYRTLIIKTLSLMGVKFKFKNVYGARMVFYRGFGAEYFMKNGELGTLTFIRDNLKEGQVFVDVGAYVGFFSIFASKIVGKNGKVLAFEPNPQAHKILL